VRADREDEEYAICQLIRYCDAANDSLIRATSALSSLTDHGHRLPAHVWAPFWQSSSTSCAMRQRDRVEQRAIELGLHYGES
jgi:hypothetical protein